MLKKISTSLSEQLRSSDQIGRLGGDEFGILLPNVKSRADVEYLATKLLSAIESVAVPNIPLKVSASIGGYLVSHQTNEAAKQIVAAADRLMYDAKAGGKKQFRIHDEFPIQRTGATLHGNC